MRSVLAALMAAATIAGSGAEAQSSPPSTPVVVELYTSQGCSSCPPADALLAELSKRDDVIALALHVDYWDYIGWKDTLADPAFTKRQKAYAYAAGQRTVYTPQMIVGGQDHVVGYKPMRLAQLIEDYHDQPAPVAMSLTRIDGGVQIEAKVVSGAAPGMVVQLVRYNPEETVSIGRGENAGKTIKYTNIVTEWRVLADWDGAAPLSMRADAAGDAPIVVVVQETGQGPIMAAARLR